MAQLIDIFIKNPNHLISALLLTVLGIVLVWFKDRLIAEFDEMKFTVKRASEDMENQAKNTRIKLMEHQMSMSDLAVEVAKLRSVIVKEIDLMMSHTSKIEREMREIEHNFKHNADDFSTQITFISSLRNDLERMYGEVERLDKDQDGLKITVATQRQTLENLHKVLVAHNETLKELKK